MEKTLQQAFQSRKTPATAQLFFSPYIHTPSSLSNYIIPIATKNLQIKKAVSAYTETT